MNAWIAELQRLRADRVQAMLVTVANVRGSAPREVGAKMLVTPRQCSGSIGGGQLEYQCAGIAAELLRDDATPVRFRRRFPLGANLGQCCGGIVEVLFEKIEMNELGWFDELCRLYRARIPVVMATSADARYLVTANAVSGAGAADAPQAIVRIARSMLGEGRHRADSTDVDGRPVLFEPVTESGMNIAIFGAGHVGSACVASLAAIDCRIRWIDSRRNVFPQALPNCVSRIECEDPVLEVAAMPSASFYLVMTHSHALDYAVCQRILERDDFAYCGLIGSVAKRRRFEKLMRDAGLPKATLANLTCPIGIEGIEGKKPAEIAIAVTAELLRTRDAGVLARGNERRQLPFAVVSEPGKS